LQGKALCKAALQEEFGLTVNANRPLLCVVSRLTSQKGLDLLTAIVRRLVDELGVQLIVQGQGDPDLERALRSAHSAYRTSVGLRLGYDEGAAHRIMSGADAIVVPSRFEPCGLTQLYGLRYGTVPVVSAVGGLVDTVVGANAPTLKNQTATGFNFSPIASDTLFAAISQAVKCYRDKPAWNQLLVRAMSQNFSWDSAASKYLALYASLVTDGGSERTV
jgi:starch synthase